MPDEARQISIPKSQSPLASVVIPTLGRIELLGEALVALSRQKGPSFEVILVANGAPGEFASWLDAHVEGVRVAWSATNRGFGGAINWAANQAKGELLVMLNDDASPEEGWLQALVSCLERHPKAAAAGSRVTNPDGAIQELGAILWRDASPSGIGEGKASSFYDFSRPVDYASGCALAIRREDFFSVGGLDETFFPAYCEDVDLCLRLQGQGRFIYYEPNARVRHLQHASSHLLRRDFLNRRHRAILRRRWKASLGALEDPAPKDPGAIARSVGRAMGNPDAVLVVDPPEDLDLGLAAGTGPLIAIWDRKGRLWEKASRLASRGLAFFDPAAEDLGVLRAQRWAGVVCFEEETARLRPWEALLWKKLPLFLADGSAGPLPKDNPSWAAIFSRLGASGPTWAAWVMDLPLPPLRGPSMGPDADWFYLRAALRVEEEFSTSLVEEHAQTIAELDSAQRELEAFRRRKAVKAADAIGKLRRAWGR
jgi:GT2 family glycosyltransferase